MRIRRIISLSEHSLLRDESRMLYGRFVARARQGDDEDKEEEAAIYTVARKRYFAAIVNTTRT